MHTPLVEGNGMKRKRALREEQLMEGRGEGWEGTYLMGWKGT